MPAIWAPDIWTNNATATTITTATATVDFVTYANQITNALITFSNAITGATNTFTAASITWEQHHAAIAEWMRRRIPGNQIEGAPHVPRRRTEQEIEAERRWIQRMQHREEVVARQLAAEKDAAKRAEALLLGCLSEEQRSQLDRLGYFELVGKSGRRYRLHRHTHGNVYQLDDRRIITRRLCAQPNGVPRDDAILAQKLALETDEESFLRVANVVG